MGNSNYNVNVDAYLVSLMSNHPSIYDKHNDFYKDYARKQESWNAIANALNLDVPSVKRRWENLRDRFVRIYREYTVSGNSGLARTKFKLFDKMLWLAPHIRKRRMTSTAFALLKQAPQLTIQDAISNDGTQSSETHEIQESITIKTETQSNASDKTYHELYLAEEEMLSNVSVVDDLPQSAQSEMLNKSDHYFMMSVVHDCQNMPPRKKIKFKQEVLGLLEKYLYEEDK